MCNTPQAFSHFTYEHSRGRILVCDIQGVGDTWTDPQIHSCNSEGYGKGNLGQVHLVVGGEKRNG
jgi:elongation factor 2 kinase